MTGLASDDFWSLCSCSNGKISVRVFTDLDLDICRNFLSHREKIFYFDQEEFWTIQDKSCYNPPLSPSQTLAIF